MSKSRVYRQTKLTKTTPSPRFLVGELQTRTILSRHMVITNLTLSIKRDFPLFGKSTPRWLPVFLFKLSLPPILSDNQFYRLGG